MKIKFFITFNCFIKKCIAVLLLVLFNMPSIPQSIISSIKTHKARSKENFNAFGHYELSAAINKSQINQGDSALIDIFITGYGQIQESKIFISCSSSDILDDSYIVHSFGLGADGKLQWGALRNDFYRLPTLMEITGGINLTIEDSLNHTDSILELGNYIDANPQPKSTELLTEMVTNNHPPIVIHLHFKDKCRADNYKLTFYLSYYNGSEWNTSIATLDIRINNWVQEHEIGLSVIGAMAALVGLLPGIQLLLELKRKLFFIIRGKFRKDTKVEKVKKSKSSEV